jgi:predicted transcriptional regulator|nr:MAG TPA: SOS-response transcriptional repressor [Caudoviricetes sp.]
MESTINGRIREFINYLDITDSAFAKKIGVTQSVIASMFLRGTEPSAKVISSVLAVFDDISAEWLLRGKGEMLISANQSKDENTERISRLVDTIATLQGTINEQSKTIQVYEDKVRKLNGELAMMKNERNIR